MNAKYALALILTLQGKKHINVIWRNFFFNEILILLWLFYFFTKILHKRQRTIFADLQNICIPFFFFCNNAKIAFSMSFAHVIAFTIEQTLLVLWLLHRFIYGCEWKKQDMHNSFYL